MSDPQTTMSEADCLEAIEAGIGDAFDLLTSAIPNAQRRFNSVDLAIRKYLAEVRVHFPDAQYYTASGGFNLMLGRPHGDNSEHTQSQLLALSGKASIGDGDF